MKIETASKDQKEFEKRDKKLKDAFQQLGTKDHQRERFNRFHAALANVTRHYAVLATADDYDDPEHAADFADFDRKSLLGEIVSLATELPPDKLSTLWAAANDLTHEGKYVSCPAFNKLLDDNWSRPLTPSRKRKTSRKK